MALSPEDHDPRLWPRAGHPHTAVRPAEKPLGAASPGWWNARMDQAEALTLFDTQLRRLAPPESPTTRIDKSPGVLRQVGAGAHEWCGVVWSDLDETTADAAIAAQLRWLREAPEAAGREFEWKTYSHDRPADLGARLLAAGFEPEPAETLMIAEIDEVKALTQDAALPPGVRLEPVTDAAGVDKAADVHEQAFGSSADRLRARMLDQVAHSADTVSIVMAMAGDVPVCAARMELIPGTAFAGLWGGGTVKEWRGKGIYRALVAHRARIAADQGYRYLQVDASEDSRPILQRLGFAALSVTTPYLITAPA
ncbi:Acetyltransferase (GNAT) family protein [Actinacidiphila cocklensis]|uniref:Acetyltransferase (GNAT) family protein n=2 Tax=Actinacidiphila cocklensis TaxID=887465 RepID=A0A9W4E2M4_9ACTN|nr:Acetyltransferase (GNAT) family protein [Actinacidiphila cocklensis]